MKNKKRKAGVLLAGVLCFLLVFLWRADIEQVLAQESIQRYSEIFDTPEEIPAPEELIYDKDGKQYRLKEQVVIKAPVTGRVRKLSGQTIYEGVSRSEEIPDNAVMTVKDEESKEEFEAELSLEQREYYNERWEDGFAFTATFHEYGADYYVFGDVEILHQPDRPDLSGSENELLRAIGVEPEEFVIDNYSWAGESYEDEGGTPCRDMVLTGRQKVWDCLAVYSGITRLPDFNRFRLKMIYEEADRELPEIISLPAEEENEIIVEIFETAKKENGGRLRQIVRMALQISVGIFAIIIAALLLRFLLRQAKKTGHKDTL